MRMKKWQTGINQRQQLHKRVNFSDHHVQKKFFFFAYLSCLIPGFALDFDPEKSCQKQSSKKVKFYVFNVAGCDYLASLPGIGLGKSKAFWTRVTNPDIRAVLPKIPAYLKMATAVTEVGRQPCELQAQIWIRIRIILPYPDQDQIFLLGSLAEF